MFSSVFQPFLWSGTFCSNFGCSRKLCVTEPMGVYPEICLGGYREIRGRRAKSGEEFVREAQQFKGFGERSKVLQGGSNRVGPTAQQQKHFGRRKRVYSGHKTFSSCFLIRFGRTLGYHWGNFLVPQSTGPPLKNTDLTTRRRSMLSIINNYWWRQALTILDL